MLQPALDFTAKATPVGKFRTRGPKTQKLAAEKIGRSISPLQRKVFEFVKSNGLYGATRLEVETELGITSGSACARINELCNAGKLKASGRFREGASKTPVIVYVAVYGVEI